MGLIRNIFHPLFLILTCILITHVAYGGESISPEDHIDLNPGTNYYLIAASNILVENGDTDSIYEKSGNKSVFDGCTLESAATVTLDEIQIIADKIDCSTKDMTRYTLVLSMTPAYTDIVILSSTLTGKINEMTVYGKVVISSDKDFSLSHISIQQNASLVISAYFGTLTGSDIVAEGLGYFDAFQGTFTGVRNAKETIQDEMDTRLKDEKEQGEKLLLNMFPPVIKGNRKPATSNRLLQILKLTSISNNTHVVFSGNNSVSNSAFTQEVTVIGGNTTFTSCNFSNVILDGKAISSMDRYSVVLNSCNGLNFSGVDYSLDVSDSSLDSIDTDGIGLLTLSNSRVENYVTAGTDIEILKESYINILNSTESLTATYINITSSIIEVYNAFSNNPNVTLKNVNIEKNFTFVNLPFTGTVIPTFTFESVHLYSLSTDCYDSCSIHATIIFSNTEIPVGDGNSLFNVVKNEEGEPVSISLNYKSSGTTFVLRTVKFDNNLEHITVNLQNVYYGNGFEMSNMPTISATITISTDYSPQVYGTSRHETTNSGYDTITLKNTGPVLLSISYSNYKYLHNAMDQSIDIPFDDGLIIILEDVKLLQDININHHNIFLSMRDVSIDGNLEIVTLANGNVINTHPQIVANNVTLQDYFIFNSRFIHENELNTNAANDINTINFNPVNDNVVTKLDINMGNRCSNVRNINAQEVYIRCGSDEYIRGYRNTEESEYSHVTSSTKYFFDNITANTALLQTSEIASIGSINVKQLTIRGINSNCTTSDVKNSILSILNVELYDSNCTFSGIHSGNTHLVLENSLATLDNSSYGIEDYYSDGAMNLSILESQSFLGLVKLLVDRLYVDAKYDAALEIDDATIYTLSSTQYSYVLRPGISHFLDVITAVDYTTSLKISRTAINVISERSFGNSEVMLDYAHIDRATESLVVGGPGVRTTYHGSSVFGKSIQKNTSDKDNLNYMIYWDNAKFNSPDHYNDYVIHGLLSDKLSKTDNYIGTHTFDMITSFLSYETKFVGASTKVDEIVFDGLIEYVTIVDETTAADKISEFFGMNIPSKQIQYLNSSQKKFMNDGIINGDLLISVVPFIDPQSITNTTTDFSQYSKYVSCSIESEGTKVKVGCSNTLKPGNNEEQGEEEEEQKHNRSHTASENKTKRSNGPDTNATVLGIAFAYIPKKGALSNINYTIKSRHINILLDTTPIKNLTIDTTSTISKVVDIEVRGGFYHSISLSDATVVLDSATNNIPESNNNIEFKYIGLDLSTETQPLNIRTPHNVNISLAQRLYDKVKRKVPTDNEEEEEEEKKSTKYVRERHSISFHNSEQEYDIIRPDKCLEIKYKSYDESSRLVKVNDYTNPENNLTKLANDLTIPISESNVQCVGKNSLNSNIVSGSLTIEVINTLRGIYFDTGSVPLACSLEILMFDETNIIKSSYVPVIVGESENEEDDSMLEIMASGNFLDSDIDGEYLGASITYSVSSSGEGFYSLNANGNVEFVNINLKPQHSSCTFRYSNASITLWTKISGHFLPFDFGLLTFSGNNMLSFSELKAAQLTSSDLRGFRALDLNSSCKISMPDAISGMNYISFGTGITGTFNIYREDYKGLVLGPSKASLADDINFDNVKTKTRTSISGDIIVLDDEKEKSARNVSIKVQLGGSNIFMVIPRLGSGHNPATSTGAIVIYSVVGTIVLTIVILTIVFCSRKKKGESVPCDGRKDNSDTKNQRKEHFQEGESFTLSSDGNDDNLVISTTSTGDESH